MKQPPRRIVGLVTVLLAAMVALGAYLVLWHTSLYAVRTVTVDGVPAELRPSVLAAAQITIGTPMVRLDLAAAQLRIEQIGQVRQARLQRNWPHEVTITVQLRQPVASTQANGTWWLLDQQGLPYLSVAEQPAGLIPLKLATPGPGDLATVAAIEVAHVLATAPSQVRSLITAVVAPSPYAVSVELSDGRTVIWGDHSSSRQKVTILAAVLAQPGTVYDISDPSFVTVK